MKESVKRKYFERYENSRDYTIFDVYINPSIYKVKAYYKIKDEMNTYNGYDFRIISHNCQVFTCGYMITENGKNFFVLYTPYGKYFLKLN